MLASTLPSWSALRRPLAGALAALAALAATAAPAQAAARGPVGRIAFVVDTRDAGVCRRLDVATMRPDGSGVRVLTHLAAGEFAQHPAWSPPAPRLVFDRGPIGRENLTQIWQMGTDGSGQRRLVTDPGFSDLTPTWSPDGRHVVFTRCRPDFSACALARVNADGTSLTALSRLRPGIVSFDARYSPDGRRIAFESAGRGGAPGAVYVMRADGTDLARLTSPGDRHDLSPSYAPAGGPDRLRARRRRPARLPDLGRERRRHRPAPGRTAAGRRAGVGAGAMSGAAG